MGETLLQGPYLAVMFACAIQLISHGTFWLVESSTTGCMGLSRHMGWGRVEQVVAMIDGHPMSIYDGRTEYALGQTVCPT